MFAYHLVYNKISDTRFTVLVAYKNVFGCRFNGRNIEKPQVLNGAGQLVIPGGRIEEDEVILAGQTEFFEETGINIIEEAVRTKIKCIGEPWDGLLDSRAGAYCIYQEVKDAMEVGELCNANIRNGDTEDEELHKTCVYNSIEVRELFGPLAPGELEKGWRGDQYKILNDDKKREAVGKSECLGDWYQNAVDQLNGVGYSRGG